MAAFSDFRILPSYARGFTCLWSVAGDFRDPGPWTFSVHEGPAPDGPWKKLSPDLQNAYLWAEVSRKPVGKANVLYFKITLRTSKGTYDSPVIQPYGTLCRQDFLVAREIMRQAVLHSKGMAGTECDVFIRSTFGPKCRHCRDPITGMVRNSQCDHCLGTGRDPAYHGPYRMFLNFSEDAQHHTDTEKIGTVEKKTFTASCIGNPALKQGDAVIVPTSDKRYFVAAVAVTAEMRRIPVIQTLSLEEAPLTDKIYSL